MNNQDIRWIQRLENYSKALQQLTRFIERGELNEFEEQGLIQSFEYTYELAWNTLKDLFEDQGETNLTGSRDVFRLTFRRGLVENGEVWMDRREMDLREVRAQIERLHAERPSDTVVIIADQHSQTSLLTQVMDQVRLGGIETVSIAAAPPGG